MAREYLNIENARIIFKNFAGEQTKFNRKGDRNFCVIIEAENVDTLRADGWNVREWVNNEDEEDVLYYLPVSVSFDPYPPRVELITSKKRVLLDEDSIDTMDQVDIETIDLTITPYNWTVNGKSGVKAYLKNMYVTIHEDPFAAKYSHLDIEE